MIGIVLELAVLLAILGSVVLFIYTPLVGAPTVPSQRRAVRDLVTLIEGRPKQAVDLGSGDGRLMLALASRGIPVVGYEINPLLVWWTRLRIRRCGLRHLAEVRLGSFWKADLSGYDLAVLYGFPGIMAKLGRKLEREMPGRQVVSNVFTFPQWQPVASKNRVHRYTIGRRAGV